MNVYLKTLKILFTVSFSQEEIMIYYYFYNVKHNLNYSISEYVNSEAQPRIDRQTFITIVKQKCNNVRKDFKKGNRIL